MLAIVDEVMKTSRSLQSITTKDVKDRMRSAIYDEQNGLDTLTGREEVKNFLARMIVAFSRNHKTFSDQFQNFIIMGPSGCGKTRLAFVLSHVFSMCGVLLRSSCINVITKADVTTAYVNESGKLMKKKLTESLDGVLFIDEAYDLCPGRMLMGQKDHSEEAITEMINFLDKYIGLNLVILAGYEDKMKGEFLSANEGIDRRFPHKFVLEKYSPEDLTDILINLLEGKGLHISKSTQNVLYTATKVIDGWGVFDKQAGDILNMTGYIMREVHSSTLTSDEAMIAGVNEYLKSKNSQLFIQPPPSSVP
jgi:SpoVK/Ycf46/Vps4 family AAA+-type ATPase